ncbi:sensor histidine kinase [Paenibacillus rigui]|nr:sensor histidine kinase [Paenibacillus rigui]
MRKIGWLWLGLLLCLNLWSWPRAFAEEGTGDAGAVLDLTGWDLTQSTVSLGGSWDLYWGQLLTPEQIDRGLQEQAPLRVQVPAVWSTAFHEGEALSNQGYGTYRVRLLLPEGADLPPLSLYVRGVATSYKLWVNGKPLASNGTVGRSLSTMVPYNLPKVVSFQPKPGSNELVMQVSNFVQRKGGIWEPIHLGSTEQIGRERTIRFGLEAFIIGSLLIMGLYHLGLYAARKKDRSSLYFGLLCLAVVARTSVLGEEVGLYVFPGISWEAAVKVEYISAFVGMQMLLQFVYREYWDRQHPVIVRASMAIHLLLTVFVLVAPARVYTYLMLFYHLFVVVPVLMFLVFVYIRSIFARTRESLVNMLGFVCFAAAILADILFFNHFIRSGIYLPYGLLFFLFTQSVHLALKFARTAREAERLSKELKVHNDTLEHKIQARTLALQKSHDELFHLNEKLSRIEQFRRQLLSDISHELGTPITAIRGYSIAMVEGVIQDDYAKYAKRIYDRSQVLERLIEDLTELTKLETGQIQFHYKPMEVVPFFQQLFRRYELDMLERASQFVWLEGSTLPDGSSSYVARMDPIRMEQVVLNILWNAKKFIPEDGRIEMRVDIVPGTVSGAVEAVISVCDNGRGIPEQELESVFDRFYRSKESRRAVKGTGLGLSICKEIVHYHQGRIGAENIPGSGCRVYFTLPVVSGREFSEKEEDHGGASAAR